MTDPTANDTARPLIDWARIAVPDGPAPAANVPAPAGLTAAQEIRLQLAGAVLADGMPIVDSVDEFVQRVSTVVTRVASVVEHGVNVPEGWTPAEVKRGYRFVGEQGPELKVAKACPDPALHDSDITAVKDRANATFRALDDQRQELLKQRDELKTELLETHADLEASRAREQIAAGRVAEVLAYLDDEEESLAELYDGRPVQIIRAILAGDQGEGDGIWMTAGDQGEEATT